MQFEVEEAVRQHKPILLVHETDDRHGKFDFDAKTGVPWKFRPLAAELRTRAARLSVARAMHGFDDADPLLQQPIALVEAAARAFAV